MSGDGVTIGYNARRDIGLYSFGIFINLVETWGESNFGHIRLYWIKQGAPGWTYLLAWNTWQPSGVYSWGIGGLDPNSVYLYYVEYHRRIQGLTASTVYNINNFRTLAITRANTPILIGWTSTANSLTINFVDGGGGIPGPSTFLFEVYKIGPNNPQIQNGNNISGTFVISGLDPFQEYHVYIRGYEVSWGVTSPLGIVATTKGLVGSAPTITTISQYSDKLEVYFSPSTGGAPGATKYTANYYISGTVFTGLTQLVNITSSPFTLTGLSSNTLYQIDLYPYNANWATSDQYGPGGGKTASTLKALDTTLRYIFESVTILTFFNGTDLLVDTASNNVPTTYFNGIGYSSVALYMFGTRTPVEYQINGVDVGNFFQQDRYQKVYVIPNAEANDDWNTWRESPTTDQFDDARVKWIWSTSASARNGGRSPYLWFYYTFFYNGKRSIDATINCVADDYTKIYINGRFVTSQGGRFPSVLQIKPGLNYIRAFAYNSGGAAGFKLTIIDSTTSELLASTNSDWAWSLSTSSYHSELNRLDFGSNDPESGAATFVGLVY
jgi:hypothetical protein